MARERQEVAAVIRDHDLHAGEAGNLGDVRVVNPTAHHPFVLECSEEALPGLLRELSNVEPRENLLLDQSERIPGEPAGIPRGAAWRRSRTPGSSQAVRLRRICPPAIPVMIFCGIPTPPPPP
jgi:hypothetical protein